MKRKTPSRPKKPSAARRPAKKIVIRVELPPMTKAQRDALGELFETAAISVLGIPSGAGINKMATSPTGARSRGRTKE